MAGTGCIGSFSPPGGHRIGGRYIFQKRGSRKDGKHNEDTEMGGVGKDTHDNTKGRTN
jgi:hypothetical protein